MAAKRRGGWMKWLVLLLVIGGGAGAWAWRSAKAKDKPVDFKTATLGTGDIIQSVTANGALSPVKNVQVGSQVSGIIQELYVDFNSPVTNKQVIAQIDPSTYEQNITQSEAELANSQAALEYAQLNYKRAKELADNGLLAPSEYDKTVADLHQAEAVVRMREASLKRAQVDLERTTIYSPTDGVVISRAVDVGQTVAASFSAPTLFQIAQDLRSMRIEAMVSEADVGGVEEGQEVTFTVDAFPNRKFNGIVSQVRFAPITNQNVVSYTCVVDVNNRDLKLRPGMTATASIITGRRDDVLLIPNAALRFRPPENLLPKEQAAAKTGSKTDGTNAISGAFPNEGGGANQSEMRRRFESMTPEQQEEARARFRAMRGGGGSGGSRQRASEGPATRVVYVLDQVSASGKPSLRAVTIKTGLADSSNTEVLEGLSEGDMVVTGINTPLMAQTAVPQGTSPFGGPFGGGRR